MPNVVTANRLTDGIVVYLAPDGGWTEDIARARFAETEDETSALEARANQGREGPHRGGRVPDAGRDQGRRASIPCPCANGSAPPTAPR